MHVFQVQATFKELLEVALAKFEDHVNLVKVGEVAWHDHVNEADDARMAHLPEDHKLSQHALAVHFVFEHVRHALDSHALARCQLHCLCDLTIRSLTDRLFKFILVSNIPVCELVYFSAKFEKWLLLGPLLNLPGLIAVTGY